MRGIGGQSDSFSSQSLMEGRGGGVSGNTERVLRAVEKVAAAAMWPETPSLFPRLWGVPDGRSLCPPRVAVLPGVFLPLFRSLLSTGWK
jgi:hypothetical protein